MANLYKSIDTTNAYANWLSTMEWTFFSTFTTAYPLTLNSARRLMERYFSKVKTLTGDANLFWVAEPFKVRDGYHTHGLLKVPPEFKEKHLYQSLVDTYQMACGSSVVTNNQGKLKFNNSHRIDLSKYDSSKFGARYCAKYLMKKYSDYDILI
jgi:hypothetical protein